MDASNSNSTSFESIVPFSRIPITGYECDVITQLIREEGFSGNDTHLRKCRDWFEADLGCACALLTPSGTHSLEMAALLLDIRAGDEVIMPSYTFVSTANAFVLRGARIVFVDIRPDTMNIDETKIEAAITDRTRAIVVVHYAGVACEMDEIMALAQRRGIAVIEDAAQCVMASWRGRPLGTIGAVGAFSFHETKNFSSGGEGGLTIINDPALVDRSEIIREKGTDRSRFLSGKVDKYSWVDLGSSYLMNEISAAFLWVQIKARDEIQARRRAIHDVYRTELAPLVSAGRIEVQAHPEGTEHNAHMFYIKLGDLDERVAMSAWLKAHGIVASFHYVPLHSSMAGKRFGHFCGSDRYTTVESERLLRLPLFYNMTNAQQERVIAAVTEFWR
ncbi:dTDP-4-amino-4,6-dideoxygalactose transaminase [Sedimentitalea todarodis]|uniref:dTDP-4-amino-4,6-dideoxygalactose transaminase n=1 Tax=Sedimentitalea todarodis TaxID=1631240 RepID=A0ABU3VHR1_9RHOB|nr:dTDP-4-amino-4,6-dideoxygalactose transaminase [Sedimentitalea todarodis]MDU9005545.1 dTDP-4-amino-4,6-dideoxygalactose transaminase [Sedimentitalea todarodis]